MGVALETHLKEIFYQIAGGHNLEILVVELMPILVLKASLE